jgi:uncharacterized protein YcbK (DUF882 family)
MTEWASPYFSRAEFACKCGCGYDTVDYELIKVLEYIREHFDMPVVVTSGCRCRDHNESVGGSESSQHLYGRASDIYIMDVDPELVAEVAEQCEAGGVGRYETFTHVDTRVGFARW